jgi:hypothetical protein
MSASKIVALETLRPAVQPNVTLLHLRTDAGLVGLREAFFVDEALSGHCRRAALLTHSLQSILLGNHGDRSAVCRRCPELRGFM